VLVAWADESTDIVWPGGAAHATNIMGRDVPAVTLHPSPIYVRNYLRAYADCVGLDESEVLERFEVAQTRFAEEHTDALPGRTPAKPVDPIRIATFAGAGLGVVVGLGLSGFFSTFQLAERTTAEATMTRKERVRQLKRELGLVGRTPTSGAGVAVDAPPGRVAAASEYGPMPADGAPGGP